MDKEREEGQTERDRVDRWGEEGIGWGMETHLTTFFCPAASASSSSSSWSEKTRKCTGSSQIRHQDKKKHGAGEILFGILNPLRTHIFSCDWSRKSPPDQVLFATTNMSENTMQFFIIWPVLRIWFRDPVNLTPGYGSGMRDKFFPDPDSNPWSSESSVKKIRIKNT